MDRFEEVKERVKEANDLVSVVESYLPLRRSGRNLLALCPFHEEKTPSFTVYPDSQHFKCYGCGVAGDVFSFVMEREGLGFRECFEMLAERAGISVVGVFGGERKEPRGVAPHQVLGAVRSYMHELLQGPEGRRAREYLASRQLEAGIVPFQLGAHPEAPGTLRRFAQQQRLPLEILEQAGLLRGSREPFHGRVMFPIEDERGRVVGFGGRALADGQPKYINSPESPFFRKRRVLYGLKRAKEAGDRRIAVMEGYTDVIACHIAGFQGAVATLGTALTREHGKVLMRYASDGVVLLFDGDRAGRAAAEKAYAELARSELVARIALLPDGRDPADLVAGAGETGCAAFEDVLNGAEDALTMWFRLKRSRLDLTQGARVGEVIEECAHVLAGIEDPAQHEVLAGRMAQQLGLDEGTLRRSMARRRRPARRTEGDEAQPRPERRPASPLDKSDVEVLACVLAQPQLAARALEGAADSPRIGVLLEAAVAAQTDGTDSETLARALFTRAAGHAELAELVAQAMDVAPRITEPDQSLGTLLEHRRVYRARQEAQKTRYELREATSAGDHARIDELTRRYVTQLREQQFG